MTATPISDSSLDLRTLTYLSHVDDNLCCPICRSPLINPETTQCRHTFCADCIAGALEVSSTCPVDRNPLGPGGVSTAPIMITNLVNDLVVLCPNGGLGCTATQPRSLVKGHLKDDCGFVTVDCPGCEEKIMRRDLRDECRHTEIECNHCSAMIRQLEMEDHGYICPKLSSPCQHCLVDFPRPEIRTHQSVCEEAMVGCDACSVGCPWLGRRKEASEHALSCVFTYLRPLLHDHASRIAALEQENKSLRKKIDFLMPLRNQSERSDTNNCLSDDQAIQVLTEQEHIRSDLERLFVAMADMDIKQSMLTMHMSDNMRTREELAMIGAAVNNLRSQLHGLQLLTLRRQSGTGSATGGTSTAASLAAVGGMLPMRRLSDTTSGNDRVKL